MSAITEKACVPCQAGAPRVTEEEMRKLMVQIKEWEIVEIEGIKRLKRVFEFSNFVKALDFTNSVGALAEKEGHHPQLITEWGKVTVSWWTHKIKGLHENDFIMAAKTDSLF